MRLTSRPQLQREHVCDWLRANGFDPMRTMSIEIGADHLIHATMLVPHPVMDRPFADSNGDLATVEVISNLVALPLDPIA